MAKPQKKYDDGLSHRKREKEKDLIYLLVCAVADLINRVDSADVQG